MPQVRKTEILEAKLIELRRDGVVELPQPLRVAVITVNDKASQVGEVDCVAGPPSYSVDQTTLK